MGYNQRQNNRGFEDFRPIEAKVGIIERADGSAMFRIGGTIAYAAVYGPRELFPRFLQNPEGGILRCHYNMLPFSGTDRVRPGGNRRSKEISIVTKSALAPVIDLSYYPNAVVDVFIDFPQTNAGSRCAGICAASMALADAGIPMKDLIAAVAVGKVDDKIVVDLDYSEEAYEEHSGKVADMPMAMLARSKQISLLQMDGNISKQQVNAALAMGQKQLMQIIEVQKAALREKFNQ